MATGTAPLVLLEWMRENLFSSIGNSVVTFVALLIVSYALIGLVPWFVSPTWGATFVDRMPRNIGRFGPRWKSRWRRLLGC